MKMSTKKNIHAMSQKELMKYAAELGANPEESLEDSATRFEDHDEHKAKLLDNMALRWWGLENESKGQDRAAIAL
jgi:hypothetical protein